MKDILKWVVYAGIFAVPFLTLYVESDYYFPFITGKNFWFRIIVDVTLAAWMILAVLDAKYRPRFSWVLGSFGVLLVVMFFANLFGQHPETSFFSNFERMAGYLSLVYTFLYALVVGSVLKSKVEWQRLFTISLVVAFIVAVYGLAQYAGTIEGSTRIDSRLGNAAYMAIYMLFHIFIAFWLLLDAKETWRKVLYGLMAVIFTFVLIETGTRGTAVGLVTGVIAMSAYIGFFGNQHKKFRKYAIGTLALLLVAIGAFVAARDTAFIQNNSNLARIANISIDDLTVRATIWGIAWEGVKERPVLGWGQNNFNYVFNEHYKPELYDQEQWFDRAHNFIFDWLIAGGFLGFLAYIAIFLACAWYLFLKPLLKKDEDQPFTVVERGILIGILVGYLTNNLVVFDNIVSYIFFALILGLIHSRVATPVNAIADKEVARPIVNQFVAPLVVVLAALVIYFVHIPNMATADDIIDAARATDPSEKLEIFKQAFSRDSMGRQELTEQLTQQALSIASDPNVPPAVKAEFAAYTEEKLQELIAYKPGDARVHVFIGTFYRAINEFEKAREQFAIARELSPQKQSIIIQQGLLELILENTEAAKKLFAEAYYLDERNLEAKELYIAALLKSGEMDRVYELLDEEKIRQRVALNDFVLNIANQAERQEFLIEMFLIRTELEPENPQHWATLGYLYHQTGDLARAVEVLSRAQELIPSFEETAQCFIDNIQAGREPQIGC